MAVTGRLARRVERVAALAGFRPPPALGDLGRLTAAERAELVTLEARCRPGEGPRPAADLHGLWALSAEDLDRLDRLAAKAAPDSAPTG